jgi:hypothetical protein
MQLCNGINTESRARQNTEAECIEAVSHDGVCHDDVVCHDGVSHEMMWHVMVQCTLYWCSIQINHTHMYMAGMEKLVGQTGWTNT